MDFFFGLLELSTQTALGFNSPSWKLSENRHESLVLQLTTKIMNTIWDCVQRKLWSESFVWIKLVRGLRLSELGPYKALREISCLTDQHIPTIIEPQLRLSTVAGAQLHSYLSDLSERKRDWGVTYPSSSNCTSPNVQDSNFHIRRKQTKNRHQGRQTVWPSVAMWLGLGFGSIELLERVTSIQYELKSSSYKLSCNEWVAVIPAEAIVTLQMAVVVKL
jgi:hypothetical protein